MKHLFKRLAGMPPVQPNEAPSSWLTRAALAQGVPLNTLLSYLDLDGVADVDLLFAERAFAANVHRDIADGGLAMAVCVLEAARMVESWGIPLLLRDERAKARCRYCPLCLVEHRRPHFAVHTRFISWRICPVHDCKMEDRCAHCDAWVLAPACMMSKARHLGERPYLDTCLSCGQSLVAPRRPRLRRDAGSGMERWRWIYLDASRSELARVYSGNVRRPSCLGPLIDNLRTLSRAGLLHLERDAWNLPWMGYVDA